MIGRFSRLSVLCITALIFKFFFKKRLCHYNNDECVLLEDMQHSQPHMTLYRKILFMCWGGRIFCKVESLIMILFLTSLASLSPPSSDRLTLLLFSSCIETYNNNFGINFFWCCHK